MSTARCQHCRSACSSHDRYCAACGTALVQLRWRADEGGWQEQGGRLAIRRGASSTNITIQNQGPVAAGLVLLNDSLQKLPGWVLSEQLQEQAIVISSGGQAKLEVPFVARQLEALFQAKAQHADGQPLATEAKLGLLTTLCRRTEAGWTARRLDIDLQVARDPWLRPGGSSYRFLPAALLEGEPFEHSLQLHNEHAEPIEIMELVVMDTPDLMVPPAAMAGEPLRLEALGFAHLRAEGAPRILPPGQSCGLDLQLTLRQGAIPAGAVGWFSLLVRCRYRHRSDGWIQAIVEGVVGRAPRLVALDAARAEHPSLDHAASFPLRVANPGDLPLRITNIELLRGDGQPQTEGQPDWFELQGLAVGAVLEPHEQRTLHYELRPDKRPFDELDREWCVRRVRLHHDGHGTPDERLLELEVGAQLGRVRVATGIHLGIDFGTSSSMVCLVRGDGQVQVALQLDTDAQAREQLPSLMYYRGLDDDAPDGDPFLYGHEADASAGIEPSNLVRSIKSVIAQHPSTRYHFLEELEPGRYRRRTYAPQELLNLFITELRRRAERAVSNLSVRQLRALQLDSGKVRFVHAIFSHPVEVSADMKQALMKAAHAAGLNRDQNNPDDFLAGACVDEATAAALAYVYARMSGEVARDRPPMDLERVLGFDVGGGTTDVAAVEIRDMASFLEGSCQSITVSLEVTAGDPLFGGDDLDELVSGWVLEAIAEQSADQGAPIARAEIEQAVGFRSFAEYYNGFKARRAHRRRGEHDEAALQDQARAIYHKAMEVLRKAEEAKCALSYTDSYELNFSAESWPRRGRPKQLDNFVVQLRRDRFEVAVREQARKQAPLVNRVHANAGWDWSSVTTMLFTGQGTRVPAIREELLAHVQAQRGVEAEPLIVVQPDDGSGFDPKRCVAMGAAIWGTHQDAAWITVRNRLAEVLTFDLQRPWGPFRFETVPGLERGTPLPTEATIDLGSPRGSLELYKDRKLHVSFTFPPTATVVVRVDGPGQYTLRAGDAVVCGETIQ
jgi:molecular chaperone DnaK (HSP70)